MLNRSPWLWGVTQTAANMTGRDSNGIQILQGKRKKGQSNPSEAYLSNQKIARLIWPLFRAAQGFIRDLWTSVPTGAYAANEFFRVNRADAIDVTDPLAPTVTYADLVFSRGTMSETAPLVATADVSANEVAVTFSALPADGSQFATDSSWVVIHNRTKNLWVTAEGQARLNGTTGPIDVTPLLMAVGNNIDIYLAFKQEPDGPNPGTTSQSRYITTAAVA